MRDSQRDLKEVIAVDVFGHRCSWGHVGIALQGRINVACVMRESVSRHVGRGAFSRGHRLEEP